MKSIQILRLHFLFLAILLPLEAKRDFTIEINDYKFNIVRKDYLKKLMYSLERKKVISVEYVMAKNITDFKLKLRCDMLTKDNRPINFLTMDANGCQLLQSFHTNNLMQIVMKEILRKGNLPKRCPIMANKEFHVYNFTVNAEDYPPVTPPMSFLITVEIYGNKNYLGAMVTKGEIRKI